MARLTKRVVDAAKPGEKTFFVWDAGDGAVKGFGLRVTRAGAKSFVAQFRIGTGPGARSKRVTIGAYGAWTVEQAIARAKDLIRAAEDGIDEDAEKQAIATAAEAKERALAEEAGLTAELRLDRLAERFMAEHVTLKRKATTAAFYRLIIDNHILPALGDKDARTISRQDVARLHTALADRPTMANRVAAVLGALYGWADRLEILPEGTRNPTQKLELFRERARERFLSVEELARLGEAIRLAETTGVAWEPRAEGKSKHAPKAETASSRSARRRPARFAFCSSPARASAKSSIWNGRQSMSNAASFV